MPPSPDIYTYIFRIRQHDIRDGCPATEVPGPIFSVDCSPQRTPNFRFHRLSWASVCNPLLIYCRNADTNVCGGVGGRGRKPNSTSQYLHKIKVCSAAYPNFSVRQLPWPSAGRHLLMNCWNADINVCVMWAGSQSSRANIYLKLKFPSLHTTNFIFRRHPSASVGFLGLQSPHLLLECRRYMWELDRRPKLLVQYLPKLKSAALCTPILAPIRFRHLPRASAGCHLLMYCWNADSDAPASHG